MTNGFIRDSYQRYYAWSLRLGMVRMLVIGTMIAITTSCLCTAGVMLLMPESRSYFWYNMIVAVVSPLVSAPGLLMVAVSMVFQLKASQDALTRAAETDALTGVANRRSFMLRAEQAFAQTQAGGPGLAVLMLDIDHFKAINDTHGHSLGDTVIHDVAQACQSVLPEGGCFARFGGEEFVALLQDTDRNGAIAAAERMRQAVADLTFDNHTPPAVTVSVGVAVHQSGCNSLHDILNEADRQLYLAKDAGRNRVMVASEALRLAS